MTNERIIFNEVCTHYDALQRHDLVSRFYTAEQVERYTAGLKFEPDGNGNTPDPVEAAEAFLCSKLFHTWAEWHKEGLTVKKGEKAAITCELWKLSDKKKQPKPDADELTKAAAEQVAEQVAQVHAAVSMTSGPITKCWPTSAKPPRLPPSRTSPRPKRQSLRRPRSRKQPPAPPISKRQSARRCTNLWPCPQKTAPPKRKRWQSGARPGRPSPM